MYWHFAYMHPDVDIKIKKDDTLEKCKLCYMRSPNKSRHQHTATCKRLVQRRMNERKEREQVEAENVKFTVNGKEIEEVSKFQYLGRILCNDDDNTKCIMDNLKRAKNRWNSIAKILKREGANAKCMA